MGAGSVELTSISWIDEKSLPKAGFWLVASAAMSWPNRVVMGLIGTSNPEPPGELSSAASFASRRQYRALLSCSVTRQQRGIAVSNAVVDGGYTPPFNKSKLNTKLGDWAPIPDDPKFYPGEVSALSAVVAGRLHPSSTLSIPRGCDIAVSALIKFRAGAHTDDIGIRDAKSPVHVPWVWCEYALVFDGAKVKLIGRGSVFPSHAWYVAGRQVAKRLQDPVAASKQDPALSTGQPASQLRTLAERDNSPGSIVGQPYSIGAGQQQEVDVSSLFT
jgi:hypothetical protein